GHSSGGYFDTPNLDRLARNGVIFENAYSASTVCVLSRVALMTGIEPHRVPTQENPWALREGFWTVAHELRRAGYQTALIGKAHFTPVHAQHGFETLRLCEHLTAQGLGPLSRARGDELDDYHHWLHACGHADWRFGNPEDRLRLHTFPHGPEVHPTGFVEREAAAFLNDRDPGRPMFLVVSFPHPHAPYNPPEPYASMFDPADARVPGDGFEVNAGLPMVCQLALKRARTRDDAANERHVRRFLASVRGLIKHIDDAIGRLIEQLDMTSTLVAFTSDHGDYAGHRGLLRKTPWMPFDDLTRVPLLYAGHGVAGGRAVTDLVQSYDFALTALDYAGLVPGVEDVDGRSLRPLLAGRPEADDLDRSVYSAIGVGWPMIRRGNHKYFVHAQHRTPVLFDLDDDPGERVNRAGDPGYAAVERDLSDRLAQREAKPPLTQADVLTAP
ncbi:MAG TPA: sulfatase-like hydrolase/transferase, partial [Acidimicrobiales bacterium]|nr:sulfatase-like hydrolase/transferase [Acidimicrobiales bacterium]